MDLCLPENWEARCGGAFRDDLGPHAPPPAAAQAFVCGLRDWRAPTLPRAMPLPGGRKARGAPRLVPYRAPAWLRDMHPA